MPRQKPMDRRILTHTVEWCPKKLLLDKPVYHTLDKVRLSVGFVFFPTGDQQSSYANFKLYFDCRISEVDGKEEQVPKFAVGDTIKIISGPINNYPTLLKIINIWQFPDTDKEHIHHIEVLLR